MQQLLTTALVLASLSSVVNAQAVQRYLVEFTDPAILELDPTVLKSLHESAVPSVRAKAMHADALGKQSQRVEALARELKLKVQPLVRVLYTNNLVALDLTQAQALALRGVSGVARVEPEFVHQVQTDVGPSFVGAAALWQSTVGLPGNKGAGVLVGVIDSGINASHASFSALSADGYAFPNLYARRGLCTGIASARCNNKLVGIYDFTTEGSRDGSDLDGHGTHVAGIAVGNPFSDTINAPTTALQVPISGVAPRAHMISYKACVKVQDAPTSCPGSAVVAAIEQAALDGVRVLNYSIGSTLRSNPFSALDAGSSDVRSMFNARAAGTVITVSAGNSGPTEGTVTSPAHAPWVLAVANITHDRFMQTRLFDLAGTPSAPRLSFVGTAISGALGNRPILLAERFGHRLCGQGEELSVPPTGASNPFAPGTFNGEIVVCERGTQARVAKGFNLKLAGAGGMILLNTALEGESIVADEHYLPTVHLGKADGDALLAWLRQASGPSGSISASQIVRSAQYGDQLNASSSIGPIGLDYLKPDLAAPGTSILAASLSDGIRSLSGTSMAAPHVAGAAALLRALHPSWGADEVESALRTSALAEQIRSGTSAARVDQVGAGRLRVDEAERTRVYFPITTAAMRNAASEPSSMNLPSLYSSACRNRCSFRRSLRGSSELQGSASFAMRLLSGPAGLALRMRPEQFTLSANQTQTLDFDVEISDARLAGPAIQATVELYAQGQASVYLPLRVQVPSAVPKTLAFDVNNRRGQIHTTLSGLVSLPRPSAQLSQFALVKSESGTVPQDNTFQDPFNGDGMRSTLVNATVADGFLWARLRGANSALVDLYVGKDDDGNQAASTAEVRCQQIQSAQEKLCLVGLSGAGTYWVVARNAGANTANVSVEYAVLSQRPESVVLMPGNVPDSTTFPLSFSYDLQHSAAAAGSRHIAVLDIRADSRAPAVFSRSYIELRLAATDENPTVLLREQALSRAIAAGQSLSSIGFSLPAGTQSARISAQGTANLALELYRAGANEANFIGVNTAAPVLAQAQNAEGRVELELSATQATAGRYYVRVRNAANALQVVTLTLSYQNAPQPALEPQLYYNPARSGHGMLITRARNDAQMIWYTYDHLGNPTWYWFFANDYYGANPGVVTGPITRYTWDGTRASAGVEVGQGALTQTGDGKFIFDFDVLGLSGSEPMELLGRSACATASGSDAPADFSGAWHQPSTTGWGAHVHMAPNIEFTNFFVYDGLGQPRWVLGFETFPNGLAQNPKLVTLYQHVGFCPTCTFSQNTRRPVGSYRLRFDSDPSAARAEVDLNVTYLDPLAGQFNQSGAFYLLTDRKSCTP